MRRVAVIGFGFSGLLVTANLVRMAEEPLLIYIIAPDAEMGWGVAYSTHDVQHLLNVPAGRMGAFAGAPEGFFRWLSSYDGAQAMQALGMAASMDEASFAPRRLYAAYLTAIWQETQEIAAQKGHQLKLVPSAAVAMTPPPSLSVRTERGDAIALDQVVLATGHELRPVLAALPQNSVVQDPWAIDWATVAAWESPVALMGAGLTAVDMVLSLRAAGYTREILAFSRRGRWPQPHRAGARALVLSAEELGALPNLRALLRWVREKIRTHAGDWREVVDGLRPHTQVLWQRLSARDQQRFLARLLPYWNGHRHRMAPEIATRIAAEMAAGTLRVLVNPSLEPEGEAIALVTDGARDVPSRIINCTGPQLEIARSRSPLLRQLQAEGLIEPHGTGLGIAVDPEGRVWGAAYPALHAVGPLMTGQWLESTAVPELREQAARVAHGLLK